MLENDSQWDFDVIRLEKLTGKRLKTFAFI